MEIIIREEKVEYSQIESQLDYQLILVCPKLQIY
jgi:hypothetical protein